MGRFAWLVVAAGLLFASHGERLNDDEEQVNGLWHLSHGSLHIRTLPDFIYRDGTLWDSEPRLRVEGQEIPVGSTLLNLMALPVAVILVAAKAVPLGIVLGTAAAVALGKSLGVPMGLRRQGLLGLAGVVALAAVFTLGFRWSGPDQSLYYAYTAPQLVGFACWAASGWLLWSALARHLPDPARLVVVASYLLGPALFWAPAAKYHSLTALLAMTILWLRCQPRSLRGTFLSGAATALLVWTHLGPGAAAVLALAIVELPRAFMQRKDLRHVLVQWGCLVGGFLVGAIPFFLENQLLTGNPLVPPRLGNAWSVLWAAQGTIGAASGASQPMGLAMDVPALALRAAGEAARAFALDLASILTMGTRVDGRPLGIFLAAPWLGASVVGAWQVVRGMQKAPEARLALAYLVAFALLMTGPAVHQGAGPDVRMWVAVLPAFAILAACALGPLLRPLVLADLPSVAVRVLAVTTLAFAALALLTSASLQLGTTQTDQTRGFLILVALCSFLVLLMAWLRTRDPRARARVIAVAMVVPVLAWTVMSCWMVHPEIVGWQGHRGGGMFVPALDPVTDWLHRRTTPTDPLPIVWNEDGSLHFHPDYGRCDQDPSPCPEGLRAPWATAASS